MLAMASSASAVAMPQPPAPVNLGSCAAYAVLAGSLVSDIPTSAVKGDVGLSPAAGSKITGFGMTEVTGTIFTADATGPAGSVTAASELTTAKGDLTIAYNDAAGRTPVPSGPFLNPGAGDIGGMTLVAGLYKFTSGLSITGSDLTLAGSATDVWIFQVASDLDVGNGIKVILADGASAANVFWQVGTSATLGTTSVFKGTIMADQSITLKTGAVLDGRALASIAAVTLSSNAVTRPAMPATIAKDLSRRESGFSQVYSNRSDTQIDIAFAVPSDGHATLRILGATGREVATLFDGQARAGKSNRVQFKTVGLTKGLYFSELASNGRVQISKLSLTR
jgi:hypothetical protein